MRADPPPPLPRSSCRTLGCAYRSMGRTHRIVLWCGKLGRTRAEIDNDISLGWSVRISTVSYRGRQHASSEPDRVPLHLVLDDLNLYWFGLKKEINRNNFEKNSDPPYLLSSQLFRCIQSIIDELLHVPLQPSSEVLQK